MLAEFAKNWRHNDGLEYVCKACRTDTLRAYQKSIRDKRAAGLLNEPHVATCRRCMTEKPIACFAKNTADVRGHFAWCKACVKSHDAARKAAAKVGREAAVCVRCKMEKPADSFTRSAYAPSGLCPSCKDCTREYVRSAYEKSDTRARYEQTKLWCKSNKKRQLLYATRSQARRRAKVSVQYTNQDWLDRLEEYGRRCAYCFAHESVCGTLAIEHMRPLSRGGVDEIDNIVPSCRSCNSRKHARTLLEFCFGRFTRSRIGSAA